MQRASAKRMRLAPASGYPAARSGALDAPPAPTSIENIAMSLRHAAVPLLLVVALGLDATPAAADGFAATGSMITARQKAVATPLADGRVLITGGRISPAAMSKTRKAEIYDPATGTFAATGDMLTARQDHNAVRLADGRVLVFNGGDLFAPLNGDPGTPAEIYDPATGTFSATAPLLVERDLGSATLLADGRVLIAGGRGCGPCLDLGGGVSTLRDTEVVELYDPQTGQFSAAGAMSSSRGLTALLPLADGGAVVIGGYRETIEKVDGEIRVVNEALATAERFDPASAQFTLLAGTMAQGRAGHAAALLGDGRVLVAYGALDVKMLPAPAAAELLDPATGQFSAIGAPLADRPLFGLGVTLDDGRVLFAGGDQDQANTADLIDVADGGAKRHLKMLRKHIYHVVAPLPGGRALVAGGLDPDNPPLPRGGAQVYEPDVVGDVLFADDFEAAPPAQIATGTLVDTDCRFALPPALRHAPPAVGERLLARRSSGERCSVRYAP